MSNKYNISIKDIETKHGIAKLERDGFSRQDIMHGMYKLTDGLPQHKRTELVKELFNRKEK